MPRESFTHVDKVIGRTLRSLRERASLSQSDLAKFLNVSYQQVQKYEKGSDRISVRSLITISKVLGVPLRYFIEEVDGAPPPPLKKSEQQLLQAFQGIENEAHKKQIIELAKSLAAK